MSNDDSTPQILYACPDCDLLLSGASLKAGHSLCCPRCGRRLARRVRGSEAKAFATSLSGLLLFFPALLLPLLRLDAFGFKDSANLLESILHLFEVKYYFVALAVSFSAAILPLLTLLFSFAVSFNLFFHRRSRWTGKLFRAWQQLTDWAMLDVYLLGILVSIIKMLPIARIEYLSGFFCFIALVLLVLATSAVIDKDMFWLKIDALSPGPPVPLTFKESEGETAAEHDIVLCHTCHKLLARSWSGKACPRCGSTVHRRKPQSNSRTTVLVISAVLLLFPANLLPIMKVDFLGTAQNSTILDGIIYFFHSGSYFVGAVILCASVLVPVFKVIGLTILLLNRSLPEASLRRKTKMYRFITFIGRWSMLDIFVISLLAAMVNFGFISTTGAAPACTWFCVVVALTMTAAETFDPRTMWDRTLFLSSSHPS